MRYFNNTDAGLNNRPEFSPSQIKRGLRTASRPEKKIKSTQKFGMKINLNRKKRRDFSFAQERHEKNPCHKKRAFCVFRLRPASGRRYFFTRPPRLVRICSSRSMVPPRERRSESTSPPERRSRISASSYLIPASLWRATSSTTRKTRR